MRIKREHGARIIAVMIGFQFQGWYFSGTVLANATTPPYLLISAPLPPLINLLPPHTRLLYKQLIIFHKTDLTFCLKELTKDQP